MIPFRRPGAGEAPRRVGLIDLGTNAVQLSILESQENNRRHLKVLEELQLLPGLGKGRDPETGALCSEAQERARAALRHLGTRLDRLGVPAEGRLAATSAAVREAPNGRSFVEAVERDSGLLLRIVSGQEEAELVALAQEKSFLDLCPLHFIDIGGGSTEVGQRGRGSTDWALSIPIGSVKLLESVGLSLPQLKRAAKDALVGQIPDSDRRPLVAVGGSATTAAQLLSESNHWDPTEVQGVIMTRSRLRGLLDRLGAMSPRQRAALPGLPSGRSDLILASLALLLAAMDCLRAQQVSSSDRGLRYGLLWERWPELRVVPPDSTPPS